VIDFAGGRLDRLNREAKIDAMVSAGTGSVEFL
jgi:hypothetical protein